MNALAPDGREVTILVRGHLDDMGELVVASVDVDAPSLELAQAATRASRRRSSSATVDELRRRPAR